MRAVDYGMARPSEVIEYDDPSLKEEESIHHDFNFGIGIGRSDFFRNMRALHTQDTSAVV